MALLRLSSLLMYIIYLYHILPHDPIRNAKIF